MLSDLELAFGFADVADATTMRWWSPNGVASRPKADGSPVTQADVAAEAAVLDAVREACPDDGFLGEEIGEVRGVSGRRWIVDGIDGTRFFAAGAATWGTLIALECDGDIVVGVSSSPAQGRRWWASRGGGAFSASATSRSEATVMRVSDERLIHADRVVTLPGSSSRTVEQQRILERLTSGTIADQPWSHQIRIAEGDADVCVWFGGDIWDHAAPSILVEEAGGRFSDHQGGRRLDTRKAIYTNGVLHDQVLAVLANAEPSHTDARTH